MLMGHEGYRSHSAEWKLHSASSQAHFHHLRHHLLTLLELLNELVDVGDLRTRAVGDAQAAGAVEDAVVVSLGAGHGLDDRLDFFHFFIGRR